ncbi:hypothetical protein Acr_06g0011820 [Actinidia rufa]|uniref:Uncharacterized protein n=1 Tax=Actinidia rufa TaxID=165716 RepID=A0A7J0ESC4_9ERIC|nr:hypothetical protein Acr_06g0011820 [Actinidia rufa]
MKVGRREVGVLHTEGERERGLMLHGEVVAIARARNKTYNGNSRLICLIVKRLLGDGIISLVVVKIWASNQQSILLGILGTGPWVIKGRPAQTNKSKRPGRGRSKPLRRGDQTKMMTADGVMGRVRGSRRDPRKDEYGKISRRCRRHNWKDCHLESIPLEMEILSTLPRPMARRRQYFGSGRSDEYSDGGSGELSGDYLARFHGFVLPRSRGFGDK